MERGIALQFRKAFPQNFKAYKTDCDAGEVKLGTILLLSLSELCSIKSAL
jgi:hypothetical protein